uniref:NADH-quinone oxidoreductase subunit F n=1 Tax=Candidatus Kentrum sp. FW TaxID=2126338 RepID=A0A450U1J2_9GAMM|nr:MAG: NADH-quinone oxidoreductase subunit F [Candidatus Kentron sp. FW]
MSKNLSELSARQGIGNNLFIRLKDLIGKGKDTPKDMEALAREFLIGKANVYGAMTFYDLLNPEGKKKKIFVCNGSACLCAGTQPGIAREMEKYFREAEIGTMTCLGRCYENSAFQYQGRNYSGESARKIADIIESERSVMGEFSVRSLGASVLTAEYGGLETHYGLLRAALKRDPREILREIGNSEIRGRGGAGYPMGMKWESARNTESDVKFIICNADEGDPGAYSDRYLLEKRAHWVLFGMMMGGYCIGAKWGVIYIRAEYPESVMSMERAIGELRDNNLIGENIAGSGFDFDFKVIKGQGSYLCGEETALLDSIEGQRPEPRIRPPFPTEEGLFNKPTVVNNVETLANIPFIIKNGGDAYRDLGTKKSTGTKLLCADSFFNKPGVYEVEMGTSLSLVINQSAGGFKVPVKALHIGGPLGGLVPVSRLDELTVDFESFSERGFSLGHASLVSIPEEFPMMRYLAHIFSFAARESCGKCFPCGLGTHRGFEMFEKALGGLHKIDGRLLDDLLHTLETGSLCAHGSGIALPVRNALRHFDRELSEYIAHYPDPA